MKVKFGSARKVFLLGNYAVKVPRFKTHKFNGVVFSVLQGWLHNRTEYNWSNSGLYDYLCPVKFSFFWSFIIIMPRGKELSKQEFDLLDKFNYGGYEHKIDSFAKINDIIYIIDYGN